MRILTFLHSFEPGGVERVALRLVAKWRADGVDAALFMGREDGAMAGDVGSSLERTVPRAPLPTAAWETLWMVLTLPGAIRRIRPDVLFCAGNTYAVVAVAMRLLLGRTCPPIVAKVSNDLDRRDAGRVARGAYHLWLRVQGRLIDRFVAMEESMLDEVASRMRVPRDRVSVIPDPALSDRLIADLRAAREGREAPGRSEGRRFVAVGRLAPQKNLPLMLRAFDRGARPDDTLAVIGDGPRRTDLEDQARRLGLSSRVSFLGYVDGPAALLPSYDALLLSSDYEGVPAVVLEALAAGLAVVATDCSRAMRGLLADGRLGTLVPTGSVVALAAAIGAVEPGRQDRALAAERVAPFTVEAAASAYLAAMSRTVGAARTRLRSGRGRGVSNAPKADEARPTT